MKRARQLMGDAGRATLCAAVLAFVGTGCTTLGPDYQRPAVALPADFGTPAEAPAGAVAALAPDWWTLFGDRALDALVTKALAANADVVQAVARVEQADALAREAAGASWPTLNAGANAGRARTSARSRNSPTGMAIEDNNFTASLSTAFELDLWGRLARANEAARAQLLAGQAARDTVRLTVAGAVAQGWFALRSLDEQIATQRATLRSREESVRVIGQRLSGGASSRLDAEQAEVQRADAALVLRELQRQRQLAQSQIGLLVGEPGWALAESPLAAQAPPPLPPPGLPSALLERRPDIRRAEELLVAANAQIGIARAAMYPSLSLTGAFGFESTDLGRLFEAPARFWSLGFGLALPLFDGGRNAARVDAAGARQREAVAAYQQAVSTAFKETADALASLRAARESQVDTEARSAAAERALKLAQARFGAGYAGSLERLEAERSAAAAALEVVRNRERQLAASVELMKALGGGWAGLPERR
ncbi:MAG: efflux transporter outer membrane subunit [Burkholderiales bacterium]|nr:efflux transporter outer membrane subunit [Burkholderiales bacterium]